MIQTYKYQTSDGQNLFVQHCYRGLPSDGLITSVEKSARSTILAMAGLVEYTELNLKFTFLYRWRRLTP